MWAKMSETKMGLPASDWLPLEVESAAKGTKECTSAAKGASEAAAECAPSRESAAATISAS